MSCTTAFDSTEGDPSPVSWEGHQGTESLVLVFPSTMPPFPPPLSHPPGSSGTSPPWKPLRLQLPFLGKPRTNQVPSLLLKTQLSNSALFLKLSFLIRSPSLKAANTERGRSVSQGDTVSVGDRLPDLQKPTHPLTLPTFLLALNSAATRQQAFLNL